MLLEQEKQRNLKKHKEELANLHKLQAQHQAEQQRWEKERERQRVQIEALEAQVQEREEECRKWEEKLDDEKAELEKQREDYQQRLARLRETTQSVEKDQERLTQEKKRVEQMQEKIKKYFPNYDDPAQVRHHLSTSVLCSLMSEMFKYLFKMSSSSVVLESLQSSLVQGKHCERRRESDLTSKAPRLVQSLRPHGNTSKGSAAQGEHQPAAG